MVMVTDYLHARLTARISARLHFEVIKQFLRKFDKFTNFMRLQPVMSTVGLTSLKRQALDHCFQLNNRSSAVIFHVHQSYFYNICIGLYWPIGLQSTGQEGH